MRMHIWYIWFILCLGQLRAFLNAKHQTIFQYLKNVTDRTSFDYQDKCNYETRRSNCGQINKYCLINYVGTNYNFS